MDKLKQRFYVMISIMVLSSCASKSNPSNEIVSPPAVLLAKPYDLQELLNKIITISLAQSATTKP
ncbi:hypothetical protein A9G30_07745 [Gilliamella sp. Fer4-1]|nr:hypothetical protein A9G30_07745 [Gilliamella apicola]